MVAYYITHRVSMDGDPEVMALYSSKVNATIEKFGGRKIVRTDDIAIVEGDWDPDRMTVTEFPDRQAVLDWYNSGDYAPLRKMRHRVMRANAIIVDGFDV